MRRCRLGRSAFTLLELVLVMVIIGTVMALASPSLRGWNRASRLRDLGSDFVATTRWARTQAIATGEIYRVCIDANTGGWWVMRQAGEEFVSEQSGLGGITLLPEGFAIELSLAGQPGNASYIEFHPTGRTQPARVRIVSDLGDAIYVECPTPSERFRLVTQGELVR